MPKYEWSNWSGFSGDSFSPNERAITIQQIEGIYNQFWKPVDQIDECLSKINTVLKVQELPF